MDGLPDYSAVLLGQDAVKKLNMLLSPADTLQRDVRTLAGLLGFSIDEVVYIFQKQYPFVYMLDQWLKRSGDGATLRVIHKKLGDLKRLDAAEIVESVLYELSERDPKEIMHVVEQHNSRLLKRSSSTTTLCTSENIPGNQLKYECHQKQSDRYAPANVVDLHNPSLKHRNVADDAPTVFTVYFPDDEQHLRNIRKFIKKMRKDGINASADMFETTESAVDRGFYIYSRLLEAEYVLVVCSALFSQSHNHEQNPPDEHAPDRVKEVSFIMKLILDEIYDKYGLNGKYIPVLLPKHCKEENIPLILKSSTQYRIPTEYEDLKRRIFGIEKYKLDPVSKKPDLKPININDAISVVSKMSRSIKRFISEEGSLCKGPSHLTEANLSEFKRIFEFLNNVFTKTLSS